MFIPRAAAMAPTLVSRDLYSSPPPPHSVLQDNPTLLLSWWCSFFSLTIILFRLAGRWIRTEKMFSEDKIMALSIIPLMARMAFVHLVLRNGTNNTTLEGLSAADIANREFGSKMVLAARIFYAMFLWVAKLTVSEFLRRLLSNMWKRGWDRMLVGIRWFLIITFAGVVVSTLTECHPQYHYWQVSPDPGPQCRQAYVQLIVMGIADMVTDVLLVAFPIYIVATSNMQLKRKVTLCLLFGLSLILVAITIFRIYGTVARQSSQQFRSLVASLEILAATGVSNALVLGSFMRDKGAKKQKFNKFGSVTGDSVLERANSRPRPSSWGSDHDLFNDTGIRVDSAAGQHDRNLARPAAAVTVPALTLDSDTSPKNTTHMFPQNHRGSIATDETDLKAGRSNSGSDPPRTGRSSNSDEPFLDAPRRMSFFDVGGLLDSMPSARRGSGAPFLASPASNDAFSLQPLIEQTGRDAEDDEASQPRRWSRILRRQREQRGERSRSRSQQRDVEMFPLENLSPRQQQRPQHDESP